MRKPVTAILVLVLAAALSAGPQTPPQTPESVQKNLVSVKTPEPAPEAVRPGFESITAPDSLAMLTFLASDLLEGRDTGSRGFAVAAEYAASLLALWGVQPAGDLVARPMSMAEMIAAATGAGQGPRPRKGYLQEFALEEVAQTSHRIEVEVRKGASVRTRPFVAGVDYQAMSPVAEAVTAPVVFVGYGIAEPSLGWDDFKGLDVRDKVVLVIAGAPGRDDPESPFMKTPALKDKYFPAVPASPMMGGGFNKIQEITKRGPAAVLQVQAAGSDAALFRGLAPARSVPDERPINPGPRRRVLIPGSAGNMPWERSSVIAVSREMADVILGATGETLDERHADITSAWKPASVAVPGTTLTITATAETKLIRAMNVLGVIEGSDPALKDEVVVVGAHLDHVGSFGDYIYNGADDNGSGSVGVLNIARAMALNPRKPRRSVVFALWTGEELGLLGSRYYARNPAYPMAKTVAYLNMDMISRPYDERLIASMGRMFGFTAGPELLASIRPPEFVPVSFSAASGLGEIIREANRHVGLDVFLNEASGQTRGMGGSDHMSFDTEKVPWAFAITAMTEDYHQTSDSVDKVSGELMAKVSRLVYLTAFAAADK